MPKRKSKVSQKQLNAIRANYARIANENKVQEKRVFGGKFPFWARLKIAKNRTTLVIDEDTAFDKKKREYVEGYVHREATHSYKSDYDEISPNPDKDDSLPMYLKRPQKLPKYLFAPHNKDLSIPDSLIEKYDKNNHKGDNE